MMSFACRFAIFFLFALVCPAGAAPAGLPFLRAEGEFIVDATGKRVVLTGTNLNGAMVMEVWASAFNLDRSGTEFPEIQDEKALWEVLDKRFGPDKSAELRSIWRRAWATPADVDRIAALNCNSVRIPFLYRVIEDPAKPGMLSAGGIKLLDDLVDACARNKMYAILDMHGAPGCQSKEHHTGEVDRNQLWSGRENRDHTAKLWAALAAHYRDRPEVAGYDLLNEPMGAPDAKTLIDVHDQLIKAIRAADGRHLIFVEDGYKGFGAFPTDWRARGWRNVAFSFHIYRFDAKTPETHYQNIRENMPKWRKEQQKLGVPIYIGEFSTIGRDAGGMETMSAYFDAFNSAGWGWSAWCYKKLSGKDGRENFWGLVTNDKPWDKPNPYKDSAEDLARKFAMYDSGNLIMQKEYAEALSRAGKGKK